VAVQGFPDPQAQPPIPVFWQVSASVMRKSWRSNLVQQDRLPSISPAQDMVNGPGILDWQQARHEATLPAPRRPVKRNGQKDGTLLRPAWHTIEATENVEERFFAKGLDKM